MKTAYTAEQITVAAQETAARLTVALGGGGLAAGFVHDYAEKNRRRALLAHPARHRELIERISREALLAMVVRLERDLPRRLDAQHTRRKNTIDLALVNVFRVNFYERLAELADWGREELESFWRDLDLYTGVARTPPTRNRRRGVRRRKMDRHLGAFADRCAFLLDSSLLERARRAAAILHRGLERKAMVAAGAAFRTAGIGLRTPLKKRTRRATARRWPGNKHSAIKRARKTVRRKSKARKKRLIRGSKKGGKQ